jgi:hypothetical protein
LWFTGELAGFIAFFLREQKWCNHGLDSIEIDNDLSGMVEVV